MRTYGSWHCPYCEFRGSQAGLAKVAHLRAHVRAGELIEHRAPDGLWFERRGTS